VPLLSTLLTSEYLFIGYAIFILFQISDIAVDSVAVEEERFVAHCSRSIDDLYNVDLSLDIVGVSCVS